MATPRVEEVDDNAVLGTTVDEKSTTTATTTTTTTAAAADNKKTPTAAATVTATTTTTTTTTATPTTTRAAAAADDDDDDEIDAALAQGSKHVDGTYANDAMTIDDVPLFMTELPEDHLSNPTLAAMNSLIYDDKTPNELAQHFREQGNEMFKEGKKFYSNAIAFYTQALDQGADDPAILSPILSNRAAINLSLGNYGRVVDDCTRAFELKPDNLKAAFRAAKALVALEKWKDALVWCERALQLDPSNADVARVRDEAKASFALSLAALRRKQDEQRARRAAEDARNQTLLRRGYRVGDDLVANSQFDQYNARWTLDEANDRIVFPVLFLYPEHSQSDYIEQFPDDCTFAQLFADMFPPSAPRAPWDERGEYTLRSLLLAYRSPAGTWRTASTTDTLGAVMRRPDYVIPRFPVFVVVVRDSKFAKDFFK